MLPRLSVTDFTAALVSFHPTTTILEFPAFCAAGYANATDVVDGLTVLLFCCTKLIPADNGRISNRVNNEFFITKFFTMIPGNSYSYSRCWHWVRRSLANAARAVIGFVPELCPTEHGLRASSPQAFRVTRKIGRMTEKEHRRTMIKDARLRSKNPNRSGWERSVSIWPDLECALFRRLTQYRNLCSVRLIPDVEPWAFRSYAY